MTKSPLTNYLKPFQTPHKKIEWKAACLIRYVGLLLLGVTLAIPALADPPHNDVTPSALLDFEQEITGHDGAPMVLIPAGEFQMGSGISREKPIHTVNLDAFYMDTYEVTTSRYATFLRASDRRAPKDWKQVSLVNQGDRPVAGVSWYDAHAYCEYYGKRLPTEAEWEKAARGTDGRIYPWGDRRPRGNHYSRYLYIGETRYLSARGPTEVGSFEAGKSPYGVYDLGGNVGEWVADWYARDYYQDGPRKNSKDPSNGHSKIIRGGFQTFRPIARADDRVSCPPKAIFKTVGFRCAQDATNVEVRNK